MLGMTTTYTEGSSMELAVYKAAEGFFIAPLKPHQTTGDLLQQRVSPFYKHEGRAYEACAEKQREYDEAKA